MELNKKSFALASAVTMAVAYLACALVALASPDLAVKLFGWLAHLVNLERLAGEVSVTWGGLIAGLAQAVIYGYIAGWIFAWTYNRFQR